MKGQIDLLREITVDGFCGGGGWSTGFELGIGRPVDIGINHDAAAGKGCRGAGDAWRVECPDCGHTVDKGYHVRHDAQMAWNQDGESRKQRKGRK